MGYGNGINPGKGVLVLGFVYTWARMGLDWISILFWVKGIWCSVGVSLNLV